GAAPPRRRAERPPDSGRRRDGGYPRPSRWCRTEAPRRGSCVGCRQPEAAPGVSTRKQAILDVTVRLLAERGPDGFTIDDVLVESDTSASSLYHHFGSREGLLAEAERYR